VWQKNWEIETEAGQCFINNFYIMWDLIKFLKVILRINTKLNDKIKARLKITCHKSVKSKSKISFHLGPVD